MKPTVLLDVLFCVLLCSRAGMCDDICTRSECDCSSTPNGRLSVSCSMFDPSDFSHFVSFLPAQTVAYHATITNSIFPTLPLWSANFSHLTSLESLHILSGTYISVTTDPGHERVFWPLENLQKLKMNVGWDSEYLEDVLVKSKKLRVLDLSDTPHLDPIQLTSLLYGLKNYTSLKFLNLRSIPLSFLIPIDSLVDLIEPLRNSSLVDIDVSATDIIDCSGLIGAAPMLTKLNASHNPLLLYEIYSPPVDILMHPALLEVDLSSQRSDPRQYTEDIAFVDTIRQPWMEIRSQNYLQEEKKEGFNDTLQRNYTYCIGTKIDDFCNIYLPQCAPILQEITLSKERWCDVFIARNILDKTDCEYLPPADSLLNPHCAGCWVIPLVGSLQKLHLQNMQSEEMFVQWFTQDKCFHPGNQLEFINLSNNGLQNFTLNIRNLSKLSTIDLSGNRITSLSVSMMNQLSAHAVQLENTTLKIDLSDNPLQCSCSNIHFTNWMLDTPENIVFHNFKNYRCLDADLREVLFSRLSKLSIYDCLSKNVYIGLGVGTGILISVILSALLVGIYRKRWWIRYNYFLARQIWSRKRREEEQSCEYTYDVFVCFNHHDDDWVTEVLKPKLEDENDITLCLHYRDFELGHYITDLVIDSIEKSRKTLLILSPHFVQSQWCMFEMRMAHQKLFTSGQDVLILAMLKPLGTAQISKPLKALLQQKNYVEWIDDEYGQKLFWARLIAALDLPATHPARSGATIGPQTQTTEDIDALLAEV